MPVMQGALRNRACQNVMAGITHKAADEKPDLGQWKDTDITFTKPN